MGLDRLAHLLQCNLCYVIDSVLDLHSRLGKLWIFHYNIITILNYFVFEF